MPTLILTVGLPRSGKTTWARSTGFPIVCPDAIRLALHGERYIGRAEPYVWVIARTMVDALFRAGHDTIVIDATNTTRKRRDFWRSPDWDLAFHLVDTPALVCQQRAEETGDQYILPVIERMAAQWEPLDTDEAAHLYDPVEVA